MFGIKHRTILFGGTFDPIHLGHTEVARDALSKIGADRLIFVAAKQSPLKGFLPHADDGQRLEMIRLAVGGDARFEASDYELNRSAPSFSLETVRHFKSQLGGVIYWLVGADAVVDLVYWHKITELIDECNLCTMYRAGCDEPDFSRFEEQWGADRVGKLAKNVVETPLVDISSTAVRRGISQGRDVDSMLDPAVAEYIRREGLYMSSEDRRII